MNYLKVVEIFISLGMEKIVLLFTGAGLLVVLVVLLLIQIRKKTNTRKTSNLIKKKEGLKDEFLFREQQINFYKKLVGMVSKLRNMTQLEMTEISSLKIQLIEKFKIRLHDLQILNNLNTDCSNLNKNYEDIGPDEIKFLHPPIKELFHSAKDLTNKNYLWLKEISNSSLELWNSDGFINKKIEILTDLNVKSKELHGQLTGTISKILGNSL